MIGTSKDYFDLLGGDWDHLRKGFFSEAVRERAIEFAGVERGRTAVDVGAGTGFVTQGLVEHGLRVIAVDQSSVMLDALCRKFPRNGAVDCRIGDAERLPIGDAAADYCFANMLLHHVEVPPLAIREMARVVRPGGRVIVTDLDAHDHEFLKVDHHDRWMGFEHEDVRRWFHKTGLTNVRVESVNQECCATSCDGSDAVVGIFHAIGTIQESVTESERGKEP